MNQNDLVSQSRTQPHSAVSALHPFTFYHGGKNALACLYFFKAISYPSSIKVNKVLVLVLVHLLRTGFLFHGQESIVRNHDKTVELLALHAYFGF